MDSCGIRAIHLLPKLGEFPLLRHIPFPIVGGMVGWWAWGGSSSVAWLVLLLVLPVAWGLARSRWSAGALMLAYYFAGTRGLPGGVTVFFGEESSWLGWSFCSAVCLLLTIPFVILWSANERGHGWRFVLAAGTSAVPPLAIIGWLNPLMVAGAIFPGFGWVGLVLTGLLLAGLAAQRWRMVAGLGLVIVLANGWAMGHTVSAPKGWRGVDTQFSQLASGRGGDAGELLAAMDRVQWVKQFADTVPANSVWVLPETILGPYRKAEFSLQETETALTARGSRLVVGVELYRADGQYSNAAVVLGAAKGEDRVAVQNLPVPISMWKPWAKNGAVADIFGHGNVIRVAGQRVGVMICYEQLLAFSGFWMMLKRPDVLVGMANVWWVKDVSIPMIQGQMMASLGRLFGVGVVKGVNW